MVKQTKDWFKEPEPKEIEEIQEETKKATLGFLQRGARKY